MRGTARAPRAGLAHLRVFVLLCALPVTVPLFGAGTSSDSHSGPDLSMARSELSAGRYEAAVTELEALRAENADNANVLNLLGYALRKLDRLDAAERHYRRALELQPDHRGANEYLGELHLKRGELAQAEEIGRAHV